MAKYQNPKFDKQDYWKRRKATKPTTPLGMRAALQVLNKVETANLTPTPNVN